MRKMRLRRAGELTSRRSEWEGRRGQVTGGEWRRKEGEVRGKGGKGEGKGMGHTGTSFTPHQVLPTTAKRITIDPYCKRQTNCSPLNVFFSGAYNTLIL